MKNRPIDGLAAKDIQSQVDKVLRGLGNPEPPVKLLEVRELLKLDLQYYSSVNDGPLHEMISKVKVGAKQLLMRPSLILDVVQKAQLRALWLPDRRRILVDETIPKLKRRYAEAHEIVHSITPHHELFLLGDDRETLCASFHEELEGEANYGASQLLFMRGRFAALVRDLPQRFDSVERLSKVFGNTLTMTLWRFVEDTPPDQARFGMITCHPWYVPDNFDAADPCRYFIESAGFRGRFGNVSEVEAFRAMRSYATRARGGPLGEAEVVFISATGERHRFRMETFSNKYEALTLGIHLGPVPASIATS
jgi:hypothetical protein